MAKIIICADDYAYSLSINAAILHLIECGILTATSCMTLSPRWPESATHLDAGIRAKADIGLHLDFTQFSQVIRLPHPQLVLRCLLKLLPESKIQTCILQQLDAFEAHMQTIPDYIDGHLHVHQLPMIRDVLLECLQQRYGHLQPYQRPWLRISSPPADSGLKARIIHWLGAKALKRAAIKAGFRVSPLLLGVYDFKGDVETYQQYWQRWVNHSQSNMSHQPELLPPVLMCHPAQATEPIITEDPIAQARVREWELLNSDNFKHWLHQAGVQPVKGMTFHWSNP